MTQTPESRADGAGWRLRPYYFVVGGVLLQGLSPVFTKMLLMDGFSREAVVSGRYVLAVLTLLPFGISSTRRSLAAGKPRPVDWLALFLVGALGSGVGALLFTAALEYSSAGIVNAISKTAPIFVAFFGYLLLAERVTVGRLALVGAMVGADALIGLGELSFSGAEARSRLLGDGLALLAGITRATSEIIAKNALKRFRPSTVTLWRFLGGLIVTGSVAGFTGAYRELLHPGGSAIGLFLLLGVVSTALSMYLYYKGTAEIPVHVAVSLKILGAVVTVIVSWVVLQERLNLYHVAGIGVLISGAYLLVLRAAREGQAAGPTPEDGPAEQPGPHQQVQGIRVRFTLMVIGLTVATVAAATALSVRHTNTMISDQTRLTMGKVAAVLVQLGGLDDPPDRASIQQYLNRVVRHRIEGETFSVDIVYIAMVDERGGVVAFAVNRDLALVDATGRPYRSGDRTAARQLLQMSEAGLLSRRYNIIPVRAELRNSEADVSARAMVEVGCKRSIANRLLAEVAARNAALVVLMVLLAAGIAAFAVQRATNPLERLALSMQRLSGGEVDLPLYAEGRGEVRQMGESLEALREGLRLGATLRLSLVSCIAGQLRGTPEAEAGDANATLLILSGTEAEHAARGTDELAGAIVSAVISHGGQVCRCEGGVITAEWGGGGEEDLLFASLAALRLADIAPGLRLGVDAGPGIVQALQAPPPAGAPVGVLLGEIAVERLGKLVQAERLGDAGPWRLLRVVDHEHTDQLASYDEG